MVMAEGTSFDEAISGGEHLGPWTHCTICDITGGGSATTGPQDDGDGFEVGIASADLNGLSIKYSGSYTDPVVVAGIPTHNGDEELVIRITRIGSSSFDLYADLPNRCGSGNHASEDFGFMILSTGMTGPIEAGQGTYGICAGGQLCTAALGCPTCDHSTGFDWVDVVSHVAETVCLCARRLSNCCALRPSRRLSRAPSSFHRS